MRDSVSGTPAVVDAAAFSQGPVIVLRRSAADGWPIEAVTPNVEAVFGRTAVDLLAGPASYADLVHPDDLSRITEEARNHAESGIDQFRHGDYRIRRPDGSVRWLQDFVRIVRDGKQQVAAYEGYVVDVTPQKRAETALKRSEKRFRDLTETSSEWFWETDADLRFTRVAGTALTRTGLDARAFGGKRLEEVFRTDTDAPDWRQHQEALAARKPFTGFTFAVTGADGSIRHYRMGGKPVFEAGRRFRGYRGTAREVTGEVRLAARATAEAALDRLPNGVFMVDAGARILSLNAAARRILAERDGLAADRQGVCRTESLDEAKALHKLVADAAPRADGTLSNLSGAMTVTRPSGRRPYSVLVAPMGASGFSVGGRRPAAVIFVGDEDQPAQVQADVLAQFYGLTSTEARLAAELVGGDKSLGEIADEFGVSLNTVKTHLKQVYRKTETKGHSDLVRLVLRGAAGVGGGRPAGGDGGGTA